MGTPSVQLRPILASFPQLSLELKEDQKSSLDPSPISENYFPASIRPELRNFVPALFSPRFPSKPTQSANTANRLASPVSPALFDYYRQERTNLVDEIRRHRYSQTENLLSRRLAILDNCFLYASHLSWDEDQMRKMVNFMNQFSGEGTFFRDVFNELLLSNTFAGASSPFLQSIDRSFINLMNHNPSREQLIHFFNEIVSASPIQLDARTLSEFRNLCARSNINRLFLTGIEFLSHAMMHKFLATPAAQNAHVYLNAIYARHSRSPQFPLIIFPIVTLEETSLSRTCGPRGTSYACSNIYNSPSERAIFVSQALTFGIGNAHHTLVHEYLHHYAAKSRELESEQLHRTATQMPAWLEEGITQFSVQQLDSTMHMDSAQGEAIAILVERYSAQAALEELYFFGNSGPLRELFGPELFNLVMRQANGNDGQALARIQTFISRHPRPVITQ